MVVDPGALRVVAGHASRVVDVHGGSLEIEVDVGWTDNYGVYVLSFVELAVGAALVAVSAVLLAANLGLTCPEPPGTAGCRNTWPVLGVVVGAAAIVGGTVTQLIALGDPANGAVRSRVVGTRDWTDSLSASLTPVFDQSATFCGALGALLLSF